MTAPDARHHLALMRLAHAVQDYRACLALSDLDPEKAAYVRAAHEAMLARLAELEAMSRMGYGANAPARNRGEVITPALRDHARRIAQSVIREMEDRNLEVNGRYPSRGEP